MQQVNLYTAELRPQSDALAARHFVLVWALLGLVLAAITGWQGLSLRGLHGEMASRQAAIEALRAANEDQRASSVDPHLLRERVAALHARELAQVQLVNLLRSEQETAGFAAYLKGLSRARVEGLWLREIRISHYGGRQVSLQGSAVDAVLVAQLLQNLGAEQNFSGQRFDQFDLESGPDDGILHFSIVAPQVAGVAPGAGRSG